MADQDAHRKSIAARAKIDRALSAAQNANSDMFGCTAADQKLGHEIWDTLEKFRRQLRKK